MVIDKVCGECDWWSRVPEGEGQVGFCENILSPACDRNVGATDTCDYWVLRSDWLMEE